MMKMSCAGIAVLFLCLGLSRAMERQELQFQEVERGPSHKRLERLQRFTLANGEVRERKSVVVRLGSGMHYISPETGALLESEVLIEPGCNEKEESQNWYYAVAGYKAWGKGKATVCEDEYTLELEYVFFDRYNWDTGKSVNILNHTVTDQFMGDFHRQGLAQEFDMRASIRKTIKWKKDSATKMTGSKNQASR